ncbi:MAG: SAM-dependent methyltransferase [Casimicrobiaceae bacterium]
MPAAGTLYVIPNTLGAVPPEAVVPMGTLQVARRLRHFVAETPKVARQFLKALGHPQPLQEIAIAELSEHTPVDRVAELLAPTLAGHDLGLVSDAGCPGIADPGALLVAAAHRAGVPVVPLAGPSSILLALMASGLNGQAFAFHGYLPAKSAERAVAIKALDDAVARGGATQICIETPYRNDALLDALIVVCRPATVMTLAIDLTLDSQQIISRTLAQWEKLPRPTLAKRPAVFLLGRAAAIRPASS